MCRVSPCQFIKCFPTSPSYLKKHSRWRIHILNRNRGKFQVPAVISFLKNISKDDGRAVFRHFPTSFLRGYVKMALSTLKCFRHFFLRKMRKKTITIFTLQSIWIWYMLSCKNKIMLGNYSKHFYFQHFTEDYFLSKLMTAVLKFCTIPIL